jgi:hypothetical protein
MPFVVLQYLVQGWRTYGIVCPKWHTERFPWHVAFTAVPVFYFYFFTLSASLYCEEYVYVHISDCIEIVFELLLLPNNTMSETLLTQIGSGAKCCWGLDMVVTG